MYIIVGEPIYHHFRDTIQIIIEHLADVFVEMHVISAYMFQYYPLFVMRMFGHLPGLPGFILSAVFSGSLRSEFYSLDKSLITIYQQCINKKIYTLPYIMIYKQHEDMYKLLAKLTYYCS